MRRFLKWFFVLALALTISARAADGGALARYSGTAVDERGQPVTGATVECYVDPSPVSFYTAQDFALKERGTTDSKGGFTVSIGGGVTIVVVKKEGLAPGWRTFADVLDPSSDPVVLTGLATPVRSEVDGDGHLISYSAPVPYALEGRVVDENGRPVAGADVWVTLAMPMPKQSASALAVAPGADPVTAALMAARPGGDFSQGSMIFGKPARDCFSARTGADGRFRIPSFPGHTVAALTAHKNGMALSPSPTVGGGLVGGMVIGGRGMAMGFFNNRAAMSAPPPYISGLRDTLSDASWQRDIMPYTSGELNIQLPMEPAGNLEGKVTVQATGQPLPGVKLLLIASGKGLSGIEMLEAVLSGADGSFRIADVLPGNAWISAVFSGEPVPDWLAEDVFATVTVGKTTKDVQLRAGKGEMAAIAALQRKDRKPLANVTVGVSANQRMDRSGLWSTIAVTGADGVARVLLLPDRWTVSASREGWNDGRTALNIVSGQTNQAEVLLDPRYRITGTVRDPAGAPVAGAIVSFVLGANNYRVTTGTNGRYEASWQVFAGGNQQSFTLLARSTERHLVATHEIEESTTNLDINLVPSVTLLAKVEDPAGKPVADAIASLAWMIGNRSGTFGDAASDDRGRIEFADMPMDRNYSLGVSAKGYGSLAAGNPWRYFDTNSARLSARGYGTRGGNASPPNQQTNVIVFPTFVLHPANLNLAGQVLGPDGKPVAGARVSVEGQPKTIADATGHFALDGLTRGPVELSAYGQTGSGAQKTGMGTVRTQAGDTNVVIRFAINGEGGGKNLRTVTTSGTMLDPSGAPVSGARLSVLPNFYAPLEVRSDPDGKYSVTWAELNAGGSTESRAFMYVRDMEHNLAGSHYLDETNTNLDLRLQPGLTLSARVQDVNGKPIPTATESLSLFAGYSRTSASLIPAKADDQGLIEITALPQETHYRAILTAPGYGIQRLDAEMTDTRTNHFDFPVAVLKVADRKLAGKLLDPDSKPVAGANVALSARTQSGWQPVGSTNTDARGLFSFHSVSEGTFRILASGGSASNTMTGSFEAEGGDTNIVFRFQAGAPAGWLRATSGTVLDSTGKPAAGVRINVCGVFGDSEARTDLEGRYWILWQKQSLGGMAWRPFISARDPEHNLAASHDIDEATTNLDLTLQPGLTLSVQVQDVNGKPIPTASEDLTLWAGNAEFKFNPIPYRADGQGVIKINALPQGRHYSASITAPGYGCILVPVGADQTQTASLQLPPIQLQPTNRPPTSSTRE